MDDRHIEEFDNFSGDRTGLLKEQLESCEEDPAERTPSPFPLEQVVFDRLNSEIDAEQEETVERIQKQQLAELGKLIQQWRLSQGYTRGLLASKLDMTVTQLFCIENSIAKTDDMRAQQLRLMRTLLDKDDAGTLRAAIEAYLVSYHA